MENYESVRLRIGRDIVSCTKRDFPKERMGVADKFLLNMIALNVTREFEERGKPLRHWGFISAVGTDAERMFGYRCRREFYELQ